MKVALPVDSLSVSLLSSSLLRYPFRTADSVNSNWSHFYTDRARYYFNKEVTIDTGILSTYDEDLILRRDYNDTSYNQIVIGDDTLSIKLDNTERLAINGAGQMTYLGDIYHTSGSIVFAKTADGQHYNIRTTQ